MVALLFIPFVSLTAQTSGNLKSKIKLDTSYNYGCDIYVLLNAGDKAAIGDENGEISFINKNKEISKTPVKHNGWVNAIAYSNTKNIIASGGSDGNIIILDAESNILTNTIHVSKSTITGVIFITDSLLLAASDKLYLINLTEGKIARSISCPKKITYLKSDKSGKTVYAGMEDGKIELFDINKFKFVKSFIKHTGKITAISISNDGKEFASADAGGLVIIWSIKTGKPVKSIKAHVDEVSGLLFSNDDKYLLTAGWDKNIFVWDRKTYKLELNINAHKNIVSSVIFWNGKLVSAGFDNTVKIWSNF